MDIKRIVVGPVETNCYLLILNNELAVIDPGDEPGKIISEIENTPLCHSRAGGNPDLRIIPKYILLTHGHFDHVMAVNELKEKYGFEVAIGEKDKDITDLNLQIRGQIPEIKPDIIVSAESRTLCMGKEAIQVIETPGHTIGSVSYLIGDNLFSGDTLFQHTHGRTDLPGGSDEEMGKSLGRLLKLDEKIKVFPGHGEKTTVSEEKNYFEKIGFDI
ncbi:MAG: MBL fold metallo-hydrolase [Patescibacteria group bacterium]